MRGHFRYTGTAMDSDRPNAMGTAAGAAMESTGAAAMESARAHAMEPAAMEQHLSAIMVLFPNLVDGADLKLMPNFIMEKRWTS